MNKLQQQSLQAKDARYVTEVIDEGFDKTHAMLNELLQRDTPKSIPLSFGGVSLNREYYNLFVIGGEKFKNSEFTIQKDRALTTSIEPNVKKRFFNLYDDRVVEQIFSLPSLFMSENVDYMRSRPGQKVLFGRVTDLTIEPNDIRISFEAEMQIFQQSITDISHDLGIIGNPGCSELNNTHWTIKQVDLINVLTRTGLMTLRDN